MASGLYGRTLVRELVLDLLLPPRCAACAHVLDRRARGAAPQPGDALCARCLRRAAALVLPRFAAAHLAPGVRAIGAFAYTGVVAEALRAVKVSGHHSAAAGLGALLRATVPLPPGVTVSWIPPSPRKLRARGVDLVRAIAGPGASPLLATVGERPDQTALAPDLRRRSPAGGFVATAAVPAAVVLVDDVRTTGATAAAAAAALHAAGAERVLVVTLAVGGADARSAAAGTANV